jgi:hypothetical protein
MIEPSPHLAGLGPSPKHLRLQGLCPPQLFAVLDAAMSPVRDTRSQLRQAEDHRTQLDFLRSLSSVIAAVPAATVAAVPVGPCGPPRLR